METLITINLIVSAISLGIFVWMIADNMTRQKGNMLQKPYVGDYPITLEFGESYGGILGLGDQKHLGIDIAMPIGTPIIMPDDGRVEKVNTCVGCSSYGKYIQVKIGQLWLYFSHLSEVKVKVGDIVIKGDTIGLSGSTGTCTGPHLDVRVHDLEVWNEPMYDYQDPRKYIDFGDANTAPVVEQIPPAPAPDNASAENYTVKTGDSLWRIAKMMYGQGSKWVIIYEANRDKISDPSLIYPDQTLIIPR